MRKTIQAGLGQAAMILLALTTLPANADVLPDNLKVERVLDNTADLGNLVQSPTGEFWLLERTTGIVRVVRPGKPSVTLTLAVRSDCQSGLLDAAFAPDFAQSGRAFVYYVDSASKARVDVVTYQAGVLTAGGRILDLGTVTDFCRPGGGLQVGSDGKLYVSVGDLGVGANAQNASSLAGKVLRANLDGSVPADNPSGTLVWARGFRNGKSLAYNPSTARAGGTFYQGDVGSNLTGAASDEINVLRQGGNFAWDLGSGNFPGYDLPIVTFPTTGLVNPESLTVLRKEALGGAHQNSVVYAAPTNDGASKGQLRQAKLEGAELDQLDVSGTFYDPNADSDGTPDAGCPTKLNAVQMGNDGNLYAATSNTGANPGLWRVWEDLPGPREVSVAGSPFALTVERSTGSSLVVGWENLGTLDTGRPARNWGQRTTRYRISEGTLPITGGVYTHVGLVDTDGTADGTGRLEHTFTAGTGDRYYLLNAQGDNFEGTLGDASNGDERPGDVDYCDGHYGKNLNQCAKGWVRFDNGGELRLVDYNPRSPTFRKALTMADFRGKVVKLTISADNCGPCNIQADQESSVDRTYGARDYLAVTVLEKFIAGSEVFSSAAECESGIAGWAGRHPNQNTPILCDVDLDGDKWGDVSEQYWRGISDPNPCGGFPTNYYIDQGSVIYQLPCGLMLSGTMVGYTAPEVNPESCE